MEGPELQAAAVCAFGLVAIQDTAGRLQLGRGGEDAASVPRQSGTCRAVSLC